jgi:superfamily II DNA or RNA helicase
MFDLSQVTPDELPLLQAMAVFDAPMAQGLLAELLQLIQLKTSNGNAYIPVRIRELLNSLKAKKLLQTHQANKTDGDGVIDAIQMPILYDLQQQGALKAWVRSVRELLTKRQEYRSWLSEQPAFRGREMVFCALLNHYDEMVIWRNKFYNAPGYDGIYTPVHAFFRNEEGMALFASLDGKVSGLLLADFLYLARTRLTDSRAAYAFACMHGVQKFGDYPPLAQQCAWQALLRGDFAMLPKFTSDPEAHFLFERMMAVLSGDYERACELIDIELKQLRSKTGKRKIFVPGIEGMLYTIAQIADHQAASLKRAKEQIDEGVKYTHNFGYQLLQPLVMHLQTGVPLQPSYAMAVPQPTLEALFCAIALVWQDATIETILRECLTTMRGTMHDLGYLWVAAEIDALLHQQFGIEPILPGWHQQHQLKPLVQALVREAGWQRALAALAQLKPGATSSTLSGSDVRMAWLLELGRYQVHLAPLEQKKSAKGIWSKGRAVALKRLAQEQASLLGMSDQDRRIAACIHKNYDGYYGGAEFELQVEKALPHLVGHGAVYWHDAPDVRIDVDKGDIALLLKEQGGQISLQLDPPLNAGEPVVWRKTTPTRVTIYTVTPEIKQIASIVGGGLSVPGSAKAQLVQAIAAIAPHLVIHSDLPELASHVTSIPADPVLYAHLLPLQEGLRLQILVRPLPEGAWYQPGKGSANILGEQAGSAVQAARNLQQEKASLQQVFNACPTLQQAEQESDQGSDLHGQEWQLAEPEACLELLAELKMLPPETLQLVWPEGERFRLAGSRSLKQMRMGIKQQGEWFVASGEITLDDGRVLALRELLQLAASAPGRFLKLGENDYLALTEAFKKRLNELNAFGEPVGKDGVRINPLAAPALMEMAGEVGELKADSGWRAQVKKLDGLAEFVPVLPTTLQAELRDYQLDGFRWLARLAHWGVGACLADDMGLGKTVQALALLLARAAKGPALVVAPISVAMNWQSEIARFAPTLQVRAYHRERNLENLGPFDIVITSYGLLQSESEAFAAIHWHSVVLDEAQVIKNAATKRSQAAMALNADFKMIASGTPVENHLGELWNLFRFINPGLLGSKERFAERFANPIERGDKPARGHLKKLIQPFILRRTKTQVLSELPSRTEITLQVSLSSEERHLYEALRQEAIQKIAAMQGGEGNPALQVLAEITKLRRFCCNPKLVIKTGNIAASKLAVFADTVSELLENRHKALVFSQFVDHLAIVREWLDQKNIAYQYLDGSTPPVERKKRVDAFQAGEGDIFLISLKAGGTGLNLTAADYVIHLDPWWNPAVEDQASDRAHRMGQTRPVTIYRLVTENTIEEKIIALHAEKRDLADSLLDGGDVSGKMDTAALLRLLKESV